MSIITVTLSKKSAAQQTTIARDMKQKQLTEPRNKQLCKCDAKICNRQQLCGIEIDGTDGMVCFDLKKAEDHHRV